MIRLLRTIIFVFSFSVSMSVYAAPVEKNASIEKDGAIGKVRVTASENEITIAESVTLKLEVTVPKGFTARMPSFEEFGFSIDFSERSKRFRPTDIKDLETKVLEDGSQIFVQEYTLEPWLSGNYSILPIMISYFEDKSSQLNDSKAAKDLNSLNVPMFNVMTDGFRINVKPMPEGRKELTGLFGQSDYNLEQLLKRKRQKDDKSDEELKREEDDEIESVVALKDREFPWWIVWTLLSMMIIFPVYWFFGRKKLKEILAGKKVPAHEIAYQEFKKLLEKKFLEAGKVKEFYYELSFILRNYIGDRYEIYAQNQTTEEFFLKLLEKNPFDGDSETILREFSEHSDNVKYSLYRPDTAIAEESFKIAKSFVDSTKVTEEDVN